MYDYTSIKINVLINGDRQIKLGHLLRLLKLSFENVYDIAQRNGVRLQGNSENFVANFNNIIKYDSLMKYHQVCLGFEGFLVMTNMSEEIDHLFDDDFKTNIKSSEDTVDLKMYDFFYNNIWKIIVKAFYKKMKGETKDSPIIMIRKDVYERIFNKYQDPMDECLNQLSTILLKNEIACICSVVNNTIKLEVLF